MPTHRRRFLASLAVAPLLPSALAALPVQAPPVAPTPPAAPEPVVDALAEIVKRRYGAHLSEDDLLAVRKLLVEAVKTGDRLRAAAPLGNADEPATAFEARPPTRARKAGRK
jgi:hypothetical protein